VELGTFSGFRSQTAEEVSAFDVTQNKMGGDRQEEESS